MDAAQFRLHVLAPTLQWLSPDIPYSLDAEILLLGTAAQESQFRYIAQIDGGPGRGLFQMEPFSAASLWNNYLAYREALADKFKALVPSRGFNDLAGELYGNLPYQVAMARLEYFDSPGRVPSLRGDGIYAIAQYYLDHYNRGGKATIKEFAANFDHYVRPLLG